MGDAAQDTDFINIYCERIGQGFWEEPLNTVTNLSFILAAFFAFRFYKSTKTTKPDILLLIFLAAIIGVGSFLFHTLANSWSMMADVIPISIFVLLSIGIFLMRTAKFEEIGLATGIILFAGLNYLILNHFPNIYLNGSQQYLPALLMLFVFGFWCSKKAIDGAKEFFTAAIVFSASIACRSMDLVLCINTDNIGTHFIWHILNGFVLYLVIKGLIKSSK